MDSGVPNLTMPIHEAESNVWGGGEGIKSLDRHMFGAEEN